MMNRGMAALDAVFLNYVFIYVNLIVLIEKTMYLYRTALLAIAIENLAMNSSRLKSFGRLPSPKIYPPPA
jgi:hypothetical protein